MLSFEQKLTIITSFPELQRKDVSLGRINFHYEQSAHDKKTVIYHLHPKGNGYVYAGLIEDLRTDDKGFVNIRDYEEVELRELIAQSIRSLATAPPEQKSAKESKRSKSYPSEEAWTAPNNVLLKLVREDDLWYIYAGLNLEHVFETYEEAEAYLYEEDCRRQ